MTRNKNKRVYFSIEGSLLQFHAVHRLGITPFDSQCHMFNKLLNFHLVDAFVLSGPKGGLSHVTLEV